MTLIPNLTEDSNPIITLMFMNPTIKMDIHLLVMTNLLFSMINRILTRNVQMTSLTITSYSSWQIITLIPI